MMIILNIMMPIIIGSSAPRYITYLPLLLMLAADALRNMPCLNSSVGLSLPAELQLRNRSLLWPPEVCDKEGYAAKDVEGPKHQQEDAKEEVAASDPCVGGQDDALLARPAVGVVPVEDAQLELCPGLKVVVDAGPGVVDVGLSGDAHPQHEVIVLAHGAVDCPASAQPPEFLAVVVGGGGVGVEVLGVFLPGQPRLV